MQEANSKQGKSPLPELIEPYRDYLLRTGKSSNTARVYTSDIKQFAAFVENNDLTTIQKAAEEWLTTCRKSMAVRTVLRRAASLNSFSRFANLGIFLGEYSLPPTPPPEPHPLPGGMRDIEKLLAICKTRNQQGLIGFGGYAGCRISESISLSPDSVDIRRKKLRIIGKGEKVRIVPISRKLWDIVVPLYVSAKTSKSDRLITMDDRTARQAITTLGIKAGIEVSSHDLRATFATELLHRGVDVRTIQYLLGHASLNTTQVYLGIDGQRAASAVEEL